MKKNNNITAKQFTNRFCVTDIPAVIFLAAIATRLVSNFFPTSVGAVLHSAGLTVGGVAILAQAILWLCSKIKNKKCA